MSDTKKGDKDENEKEKDPIYEQLLKIPQEIKTQVEIIAQEIWKEERLDIIKDVASILEITPDELESQLLNIRVKRGRPRKNVIVANKF
jgi:capsular polysaccharide biosynthesis protein